MMRLIEKPWIAYLALTTLVAATQFGGFAREVIDWDESTFILLASRLVDGHLPYIDLFDNKPPMMFVLLAAVMAVFGENLFTVRVFGDLCIVVSVILTVMILKRNVPHWPAIISGIFLVFLYAADPGQHTSTELPAMAMVMGALYLMLRARGNLWAIAGVALLISFATLTRSNLAVLAIAVGGYLVIAGMFLPNSRVKPLSIVVYATVGLTPLFFFIALYWMNDGLDTLIVSTVNVAFSYATKQSSMFEVFGLLVSRWFELAERFPLWLAPATLMVFIGCGFMIRHLITDRIDLQARLWQDVGVICLFAGPIALSVLITGAAYGHYWLHFFPFIVMLITPAVVWAWPRKPFRWSVITLVGITAVSGLIHTAPDLVRMIFVPNYLEQSWYIREASDQIKQVDDPEAEVWALTDHLILWYLDKTPISPTFAHPSSITRPSVLIPLEAAGYVEENLLARTMDSRPAFIVNDQFGVPSYLGTDPTEFETYLADYYGVYFENEEVIVYRRLGHLGWSGPAGECDALPDGGAQQSC